MVLAEKCLPPVQFRPDSFSANPLSITQFANTLKANEHNRAHLESLETTPYPLEPLGKPVEVAENQRITEEGLGQR